MGCTRLFASLLIIQDPNSASGKTFLEQLEIHHRSIDAHMLEAMYVK